MAITVKLTPAEAAAITDPVDGEGGFQNLLRDLQSRLQGNALVVQDEDAERVHRYASEYGPGGFQERLIVLKKAIDRAKASH